MHPAGKLLVHQARECYQDGDRDGDQRGQEERRLG